MHEGQDILHSGPMWWARISSGLQAQGPVRALGVEPVEVSNRWIQNIIALPAAANHSGGEQLREWAAQLDYFGAAARRLGKVRSISRLSSRSSASTLAPASSTSQGCKAFGASPME